MLWGNNVLFSAPTLEEVTLYIHKDRMVILTKFSYQQNLAGFGNCYKFEHSVEEESFEIECRALLGVGTKQGNKRDVNLTKQYACTFVLLKARIKPRLPSALSMHPVPEDKPFNLSNTIYLSVPPKSY